MLTLFTTAKPFHGHSAIIQRNALKSWTLLHPDVEVILFGDDAGAAETARELRLRYEPYVSRSEHGSKRLDYMFSTARAVARHDILCYVNCDIILMDDFLRALKRVREKHMNFLMVGRRWDIEMPEPVDYLQASWRSRLQGVALMRGVQRSEEWIDYFAFSKGLYGASVPRLVVGRVHWDQWLVWKALDSGAALVDASRGVIAVHQNHDYSYHPNGRAGVWNGIEADENFQLTGNGRHKRRISDATEVLDARGIRSNAGRYWSATRRTAKRWQHFVHCEVLQRIAFFLLDITRPVRHALGLRSGALRRHRQNA
ncbi:MAG TPA: hypothetical protein VGJ06_05825 [Candidatus Acidoferrum sp.]